MMNPMLWVPLLLILLCALMAASGNRLAKQRKRKRKRVVERKRAARTPWIHAINDDRCTGCEACVEVCPTHVLDLVDHKSHVLRPDLCIECRQCTQACPTSALVMHRSGMEPPTLRIAELDGYLQTSVPGQYLIGEVAGKPLVKNAANMGRLAIEHIVAGGLSGCAGTGESPDSAVDVAIVGSGPGGLSAALTCKYHSLSCIVFEKDFLMASTIARYPKGKKFLAEPYETKNLSLLPVFDATKEQLVDTWTQVIEGVGVNLQLNHPIDSVRQKSGGVFEIVSPKGTYYARRVVMAIGTRGKPRTLGVPGESLVKVATMLDDPAEHRGQRVLVVGGGDSALEAACAMSDCGAEVTLSYRGRAFARAKKKNRDAVKMRVDRNTLTVLFGSKIKEITDDLVLIELSDGTTLANDAVYVLIGADAPIKWLEKQGVRYADRPHSHRFGATDELVAAVTDAIECPDDPAAACAVVLRQQPGAPRQPPGADHANLHVISRARVRLSRGTPTEWDTAPTTLHPRRGVDRTSQVTPIPLDSDDDLTLVDIDVVPLDWP